MSQNASPLYGTVAVNGLKIYACHGVAGQEHRVGNMFEVTASLRYDCGGAMLHDNLQDAVNYAEMARIITDAMSERSQLIEHVAYRIFRALTDRWQYVVSGSVTVKKLHPPMSVQLNDVSFTFDW